MAIPSTEIVQQATTKLLEEARAEGKLSKLTVRIVRERLEESLDLSPGTLGRKRDNVSTPPNEADGEKSQPKPSKKRKVAADEELVKPRKGASKPKASPGKSKKGKQVPKSSAVVDSELSEISEDEVPAREKQVKPPKNKAVSELQSEGEDDDEHEAKTSSYKSTVESSGDEADAKCPSESVVTSLKKEIPSPKKSPSKEKPLSKPKSSTKQDAKHELDDEFKHGASSSTSKSQEPVVLKHARPHSEPENDSDMSVVIDEPPKKRRKKQEKDSNKKPLTERKKARKSNTAGSKDDETVSKLKVACGVRKMWKKEFRRFGYTRSSHSGESEDH
ncbi:hypothetical protein DFJ58DRAFT_778247 [Suillus subalutaceus]|uniref:uncharacterized protein n=1 Tax=Suillus subalutaceus TaxID=48586 RepID=UPI001B8661C8|nr:uncharacterized protein DFJ58DRAFT_778247 [Suillus subalutaceus]KAG1860622.1 hypothetical protein DFJ58DRAFT_778247 [Suillus subalutaceus]